MSFEMYRCIEIGNKHKANASCIKTWQKYLRKNNKFSIKTHDYRPKCIC